MGVSTTLRVLIGILTVLALALVGFIAWLFVGPEPPADEPPDPDEPDPVIAPLTGGEVDEPVRHAVFATKVANIEEARPQTGLSQADIVYEVLTEGGITRFIALFHSTLPDEVGPIRSAREVDVDVLPPYDPVFAISGAREEVLAAAREELEVVTEGTGFYRADDRPAPHDLYVLPEDVLELADGPPPLTEPVWTFDERVPSGGTPAAELSVQLSPRAEAGWSYDEDDEVYRRFQNGAAHEDLGGEVGAANVVVIGVTVEPRNELVDIGIIGEGDAVVLRDGQRYDARWEKASRGESLTLTEADGEDVPLRPGPTWVVVAPQENLPSPVDP